MDSAVTLIGVVLTGLFGVYIVVLQRQTHNEVKSPNGTSLGNMVYELRDRVDRIGGRLSDVEYDIGKFRAEERTAHAVDKDDRSTRADQTKAGQQEIVHAVKETPNVVVVSPLPADVGRPDLSSGGKTE